MVVEDLHEHVDPPVISLSCGRAEGGERGRRLIPDESERCLRAPAATQAVVHRVEVPPEVAAWAVHCLAQCAVKAIRIGDVAAIQLIDATSQAVLNESWPASFQRHGEPGVT